MQARKITLIEIGAGALPSITPVPVRQSSWFPTVYVSPDVPPVEGVVPNPVADGVLIEWDAVDQDGVIYIIERGPTAEGPWMEIARVVETRYLYSDGSGQQWWFKITASVRGKPGQGSIVVATPPPTVQEILDLFAEQARLAAEMAAGFSDQAAQIASLEAALAAADFDADVAYSPAAVVKWQGGLYYALVETLGNLPSNTTYWRKIGEYDSLAEAVGAQAVIIASQQTRLEQTETGLAAVAQQANAVAAALPGKADTSAVNALAGRVTQTEQGVSANTQAINSANAAIGSKADASTVQALQGTVLQQGNKLDAQALVLTGVTARTNSNPNALQNPTFREGFRAWSGGILGNAATYYDSGYGHFFNANGVAGGVSLDQAVTGAWPAGQYTLSGEIYRNSAAGTVRLELVAVNASGGLLASLTTLSSPAIVGQWQQVVVTLVVPAGTAVLNSRIIMENSAGGNYSFRRMKLERSPVATVWSDEATVNGTASATQALEARTTINENGLASYFASWTMSLDANGRVAGIRSVNNGATSTIDFLFDKVRFVSPGSGRRMEYSDGHFLGYDENNVRRLRLGTWNS
jgi:hypothetical protein